MAKRILLAAILCLCSTLGVSQGQGPQVTSLSGSGACAKIAIDPRQTASVDILVTGTWATTLQPEVGVNGNTPTNTSVYAQGTTTSQSTITANGDYTAVQVAGHDLFQVCFTTYASGTAVVTLTPSTAIAGNTLGGGGGGGSGVSSLSITVPTGLNVNPATLNSPGTFAFTWQGTIPNAQVPNPSASALGGVESITCSSQFINQITTSGVPACASLTSGEIPNNAANTTGTAGGLSGTPNISVGTIAASGLITANGGETVPSGETLTIASGATLTCASGSTCPSGTGTVTSVSVVTANGVSGTVANATSTPAITLTLGAITPSSVAATGNLSGVDVTASSALSGASVTDSGLTATYVPVASTGGLLANSLATDNGTTWTYTGSGGIAVTSSLAGLVNLGFGTAQSVGSGVGLTTGTSGTAYLMVLPTVIGTANALLQIASVSGTTAVMQWGTAGASLAFPETVSGTTFSGGIPYFSSATALSSSNPMTNNIPIFGGGAGQPPTPGINPNSGSGTATDLACFTASGTVGNCTSTTYSGVVGVWLTGGITFAPTGITPILLDASTVVAFGDILCGSTTNYAAAHDNGSTPCTTTPFIGVVQNGSGGSGVSVATASIRLAPIPPTGGGTGTVTVVSSGSLTSTAIVTGGGSQTLQTPSATSTLSSAGNMSLAGSLTTTPPSGDAGAIFWPGNTANQSIPANQFAIGGFSSASATAYGLQPSNTAPSGNQVLYFGTPSSGWSQGTWISLAGSGSGLTTGPTSTTSGDLAAFTGTGGQIAAASAGILGASGTAGTLAMYPASGNFTTTLGSAATASNTIDFFAAVPTNLHLFYCAVSSTTCTLTDAGYAYNAIPLTALATEAANTVLGNFGGSTAGPSATAVASCSGNNDGEIYTTNTGFGCGTNFAQLNVAQTQTALYTFGSEISIAATAHGVLLSENTSAVVATSVGATNTVLNGNTGADPSFGALPLAAHAAIAADTMEANMTASSAVPTAVAIPTTAHGVWLGEGTATAPGITAAGGSNFPLIGQGSSADPIFSTIAYPTSMAGGSLLYGTSSTAIGTLTSTGYSALVSGATNPQWSTPTANGQCFMSGASSYATTIPSFQSCPSSGGGGGAVGYSGAPVVTATVYVPLMGDTAGSTTRANVGWPAPSAAPISNLQAYSSSVPGTGNTLVVTLYDGSTAEALTCTITAAANSCSDTTHTFTPAAGDLLTWQISPTGTVTITPNIQIGANWATPAGNSFSGNTTVAASASSSVASAAAGVNIVADGSGNVTPATQVTNATVCTQHYHPVAGSSDQISAAGAFATTASINSTCMAVGTLITIRAHGVFTTSSTSSPKFGFEINAGGTTGICPVPTTVSTPLTNLTSAFWDAVCYIQINTTGSPGTAVAWGDYRYVSSNSTDLLGSQTQAFSNQSTGTVSYTTSGSETVSVQETGTLVSGQTFNLTALDVTVTQ